MTAPPPSSDDPASLARRCWDDLEAQRRRRGVTLRHLEEQLRSSKLPRRTPAYNTLQNWFARRTNLPDKLVFLEIARLLQLEEQHWGRRWEQWDRAQYAPHLNVSQADFTHSGNHGQSNQSQPDPVEDNETAEPAAPDGPETEQSSIKTASRSRRTRQRAIAAGAVAGAILAGLGVNQVVQQLGGAEEERGSIKCAAVAVATTNVFRNPDGLQSIAVKRQGDRITLPSGYENVSGSDGRRYSVVLTPTRTPSGQAYMLADTLTPTNC